MTQQAWGTRAYTVLGVMARCTRYRLELWHTCIAGVARISGWACKKINLLSMP